jgi:hypothetical protein
MAYIHVSLHDSLITIWCLVSKQFNKKSFILKFDLYVPQVTCKQTDVEMGGNLNAVK